MACLAKTSDHILYKEFFPFYILNVFPTFLNLININRGDYLPMDLKGLSIGKKIVAPVVLSTCECRKMSRLKLNQLKERKEVEKTNTEIKRNT